MQKLEEQVLLARWKSYKTFKHSGEIRLHTSSFYREFCFTVDRMFTVKAYKGGKPETHLQTDQWMLEFNNSRHYLAVPREKLTFEIITVNHTVLVLLDMVSWDKTFFTKEALWPNYLQSNEMMVM